MIEASLIGGALVLAATFAGGVGTIPALGTYFNLSARTVTLWMAVYGFFAAVLPVWVLLCRGIISAAFSRSGRSPSWSAA